METPIETATLKQVKKATVPDNIRSMSAHIGLGVLYAVIGLGFIAIFGSNSASVMGTILFILMLGIAHGVIAFGAARAAPWARTSSMVIGCLMLLGFPIGTIIGVYLLVNLKWPPPTTQ
ncbi:hypothetical protein SAMN05216350_10396 [Polaromonas sp. YR568]|uniref:hypothetical protein n=1 Tax=Polaromonas sp. YR568 TaxID=1855301 RepID=UPI0008F22F3D|nr:hypothetical protein [Polaromonas sp. YR568]SFU60725.1 hypothetical protein SAMN05216350_10396 [Polaromonas sp. YR568]